MSATLECRNCGVLGLGCRPYSKYVATHHNGKPRILVLLVHALRAHVDAGQPAAIAGVRVVPAQDVFQAARLCGDVI